MPAEPEEPRLEAIERLLATLLSGAFTGPRLKSAADQARLVLAGDPVPKLAQAGAIPKPELTHRARLLELARQMRKARHRATPRL